MTDLSPEQELEVKRQLAIIRQGTADIVPEGELLDKLRNSVKRGSPLRMKLGMDPTAPDLHLGHTVVLHKIRQLQDLGHHASLVIGDFTARIGDPTDKSETRKQLTREQVDSNAKTYVQQVFKVLDAAKTEIVYNSTWLAPLGFPEVIGLASSVTVARMLERDDFTKRFRENRPIHLHEFFYPIMQAYDSVHLETDIELGGTDQRFNLLMGRTLQRDHGQHMQVAVMMPLLEGIDGVHKMSKSLGNYIGVDDAQHEMFGKVMSIPDELMFKYYELLSFYSPDEIAQLREQMKAGIMHPRDAKIRLARELVGRFSGEDAARDAVAHWENVFQKGSLPDEIEEYIVDHESQDMVKLLTSLGYASSNRDARRLLAAGAIKLNGRTVTDPEMVYNLVDGDIISRGKRQFRRIRMTCEA